MILALSNTTTERGFAPLYGMMMGNRHAPTQKNSSNLSLLIVSVDVYTSSIPRVYKEGEGECQTAYMLCVTAVRMVYDLCNDIHVWRSLWNVLALMQHTLVARERAYTSTTMVYLCVAWAVMFMY